MYTSNNLFEAVSPLNYIREFCGSNLGQDTEYPD
jgi:hypothetical protein